MGFRVTKHSRLGVDIVFVHPPCISLYYCENILSNVADSNILGLYTEIEEDDSKMTSKLCEHPLSFQFLGKMCGPLIEEFLSLLVFVSLDHFVSHVT